MVGTAYSTATAAVVCARGANFCCTNAAVWGTIYYSNYSSDSLLCNYFCEVIVHNSVFLGRMLVSRALAQGCSLLMSMLFAFADVLCRSGELMLLMITLWRCMQAAAAAVEARATATAADCTAEISKQEKKAKQVKQLTLHTIHFMLYTSYYSL